MQDVLQLLKDNQQIDAISQKLGVSREQIETIAALGLPTLLEAMNRNADGDGADGLARALDDHATQEPFDMNAFLNRFSDGEGERMVGHIFGSQSANVEDNMAQFAGMKSDTVRRILSILAPLLLANMASKWSKRKQMEQQQTPQQQQPWPQQAPPSSQQRPWETQQKTPQTPPGGPRIEMPNMGQPRTPNVRDFTRETRREFEQQQPSGGSIFDMAKDILGGGSSAGKDGNILGDILGSIFGR